MVFIYDNNLPYDKLNDYIEITFIITIIILSPRKENNIFKMLLPSNGEETFILC